MLYGYMGKILWVDLTQGKTVIETPDEKLYRDYIGGYGLGAKFIFDRQKPGANPLGSDNILGFVTGTLCGTQALAGSRYTVVGKSPLTGTWGDANSGGAFGPFLRFSGYDAIFCSGVAARPVYVLIDNGKAEIRDAGHLWGKDCYETEDVLKNECGKDTEVACIGPAGEKLSLSAAVMNQKGRAAGRSGLGALMGSKKLKAIAVKGKIKIPVFDEIKTSELRKKYMAQMGGPLDVLRKFGSSGMLQFAIDTGDGPIKNWTGIAEVDFPQYKKLTGDQLVPKQNKRYACYRCAVGCGAHMKAGTEYQYEAGVHIPEYETLGMFGLTCLNENLESIIKANDICNRYGLDTISTGAAIAFTIECYENAILTKKDTDGLEMTWGNHKSIVAMTEKLANREGFGNVIADGTRKAAERIGRGSEKYAMNIHGQDYPAHDPRPDYSWKIAYIMDPTPGRHTRAAGMVPAGLPVPVVDKKSFVGRAAAEKVGINFQHFTECAGCCMFVTGTWPDANTFVEFFNSVTGWGLTATDMLKIGERIANIRQAFNIREGVNQFQFKGPDRLIGKPPLAKGPYGDQVIDEKIISRELCEAMDWDIQTAKPSQKKLLELGMEDVARVLYQ